MSLSKYRVGHLSSRPKITVEIINAEITKILEFINNHPEITQEQLEKLDRKIKSLYKKMETAYLVEAKSDSKSPNRHIKTPAKSMRKSVRFSPGTKQGGKTKRRRIRRL